MHALVWSRTLDTDGFFVAVRGSVSVQTIVCLATETLSGGLMGFVFFPVDLHVFHISDVVICGRGLRRENHSVYRIFTMCGDFQTVDGKKALIFSAVYDSVFEQWYQSFYHHCQSFLYV